MKTALATNAGQNATNLEIDSLSVDNVLNDMRSPRPEAASVYELEVLICRIADGETRGRAANLPLRESRASTVREVLQLVIEQAREMINECLARDKVIPWIEPSAPADENESRFVVPLVMSANA